MLHHCVRLEIPSCHSLAPSRPVPGVSLLLRSPGIGPVVRHRNGGVVIHNVLRKQSLTFQFLDANGCSLIFLLHFANGPAEVVSDDFLPQYGIPQICHGLVNKNEPRPSWKPVSASSAFLYFCSIPRTLHLDWFDLLFDQRCSARSLWNSNPANWTGCQMHFNGCDCQHGSWIDLCTFLQKIGAWLPVGCCIHIRSRFDVHAFSLRKNVSALAFILDRCIECNSCQCSLRDLDLKILVLPATG